MHLETAIATRGCSKCKTLAVSLSKTNAMVPFPCTDGLWISHNRNAQSSAPGQLGLCCKSYTPISIL